MSPEPALTDFEATVVDGAREVVVEPVPQLRPPLVVFERRLATQPLHHGPAGPVGYDHRAVVREVEETDRVDTVPRINVQVGQVLNVQIERNPDPPRTIEQSFEQGRARRG